MFEILLAGLVLGFHHALDADHVAALANLMARERSARRIVRHGASWGVGHAMTLATVVALVIVVGGAIPERWSLGLEAAAGLMLIALGAHLLFRLWRDGVHLHVHRHAGQGAHFHFHAHRGNHAQLRGRGHALGPHDHAHGSPGALRSLLVGMVHGLAGSAALLIVAIAAMREVWGAIVYAAVFSLGTILGMIVFSALLSVPMTISFSRFPQWHRRGQALVALASLAIGAQMAFGFLA
jgi:cytochrome c biogenesis protein CcdA